MVPYSKISFHHQPVLKGNTMSSPEVKIVTIELSLTERNLLRDALDSHLTRMVRAWERATDLGGRAEAAALSRRMQKLDELDARLSCVEFQGATRRRPGSAIIDGYNVEFQGARPAKAGEDY
jgi:hypothetical protein